MNHATIDLISVVIPTFNGARFLSDTLQSVYEQSQLPDEVVVVDDASTDETRELVCSLAVRAPMPVKLIELNSNSGGPAHPLNVGIEAARGGIIVPLDQDDLMTPDRVAWQARLLREHPDCPLVFGLYRVMKRDGSIEREPRIALERILAARHIYVGDAQYRLDARDCYRRLIDDCNFVHGASNMAFRKEAIQQLGGINEQLRVVWDYDLACRACMLGDLGFVGEVVQIHRIHESNLSGPNLTAQRESAELRWAHVNKPWLDVDLSRARSEVAALMLGLGYFESRHGNLRASFSAYMRGLKLGASRRQTLSGLVKAPPHVVWSRLNRRVQRSRRVPS